MVMEKTEIKGNKKKKRIVLVSMVLVIVAIFTTIGVYGYVNTASSYTVKEHTERISKLAKKRYIDSGKFTGYKVYPLYNEKEELELFLIDLEPHGFVYICVRENSYFSCLGATSMYVRDFSRTVNELYTWQRYKVKPESSDEDDKNKEYETDENGDFIYYTDSPYKVANTEKEKKYLLRIGKPWPRVYIPAVKRGDKYLNLISMEEFEYKPEIPTNSIAAIGMDFMWKPDFNL